MFLPIGFLLGVGGNYLNNIKFLFRLTIYTLVKLSAEGLMMDLVDIHGYVQQVSVEDHKNALGLGWGLFFGSIVLNIVYFKLHPAAPSFAVTSDDKLRTHVCGTVWNWKKCVCGGN